MKNLILESLRRLAEDNGYKVLPTSYDKEFNQTGSGKAIHAKTDKITTSSQINSAKARIIQAHNISNAYKEAFINGTPDDTGMIRFDTTWNGKTYNCQIPQSFKTKLNLSNKPVDYLSYFDYPELGDGGFQVSLDKSGFMQARNLTSKPDIQQSPNLSSATDAGYEKEYQGRIKYFRVKAGVNGKTQESKYCVFPTPAIDATIKANLAFKTEIIDFLNGSLGYTSDDKGKELSNQMDIIKKLEKIRKDAERILGRPLSSNQLWMDWKSKIQNIYNTPQKQLQLDIAKLTNEFLIYFKSKASIVRKPEISMSSDELEDFEKRQTNIKARLDAMRARKSE